MTRYGSKIMHTFRRFEYLTIIALSLLVGACSSEPNAEMMADAHKAVAALMKDPDSAKFDDQNAQVFPELGLFCWGKINAKNSYGAYNGYEFYYYARDRGAAILDDDQYLSKELSDRCAKASDEHIAKIYRSIGKPVPKDAQIPIEESPPVKSRFPYVAPDGVNIDSERDEKNLKKYGTTDPNGGE